MEKANVQKEAVREIDDKEGGKEEGNAGEP